MKDDVIFSLKRCRSRDWSWRQCCRRQSQHWTQAS